MKDGEVASISKICHYLDLAEPFEDSPKKPLQIFMLNGVPYFLHVDVNEQDDKYGMMWEWWISNPDEHYVDGGFEPANSADEVVQLAGVISGACKTIISERQQPGA